MSIESKFSKIMQEILESDLDIYAKQKICNLLNEFNTFTIKCDYCDNKVEECKEVPQDWLSMRFREEDRAAYIPGPTLCPKHFKQIKMIGGKDE